MKTVYIQIEDNLHTDLKMLALSKRMTIKALVTELIKAELEKNDAKNE